MWTYRSRILQNHPNISRQFIGTKMSHILETFGIFMMYTLVIYFVECLCQVFNRNALRCHSIGCLTPEFSNHIYTYTHYRTAYAWVHIYRAFHNSWYKLREMICSIETKSYLKKFLKMSSSGAISVQS